MTGHGSSRHGAAGTATLPVSTVNAGVGFQILKDRPDLAANVDRVRVEGHAMGHGVTFYVDGDETIVELWTEFLGPSARVHPVIPYGNGGWEQGITTLDTAVIVRHRDEAN